MALVVCLLTASGLHAQAPAPPPPPSVAKGQAAPDLTAVYLAPPDADGRRQRKEVTLRSFKGQRHVVLAFFPAAFSPGCTNEMAKYQETAGQFNANNTVILGISVDSPWANAAFAEKLGVQFPILSDTKRDISRSEMRSPGAEALGNARKAHRRWQRPSGSGKGRVICLYSRYAHDLLVSDHQSHTR